MVERKATTINYSVSVVRHLKIKIKILLGEIEEYQSGPDFKEVM